MEFGNTWGNEKEYALYFFNDRLIKWGYLNDDWPQLDISDGDILTPLPSRYQMDTASNKSTVTKDKHELNGTQETEQ